MVMGLTRRSAARTAGLCSHPKLIQTRLLLEKMDSKKTEDTWVDYRLLIVPTRGSHRSRKLYQVNILGMSYMGGWRYGMVTWALALAGGHWVRILYHTSVADSIVSIHQHVKSKDLLIKQRRKKKTYGIVTRDYQSIWIDLADLRNRVRMLQSCRTTSTAEIMKKNRGVTHSRCDHIPVQPFYCIDA